MRIAIVEDHAAERQLMAVMCAEYFKRTRDIGVECVTFADAESFIESWKDARYALLLLDCYLSDDETATHAATGLDIARTLRSPTRSARTRSSDRAYMAAWAA